MCVVVVAVVVVGVNWVSERWHVVLCVVLDCLGLCAEFTLCICETSKYLN